MVQKPSEITQVNVILVPADDMGFSDLGYRCSEISTLNIDAMAREVVRFSQM